MTLKQLQILNLSFELQESMVMYQTPSYFSTSKEMSFEGIISEVAGYFGLSTKVIKSESRERIIKDARFFSMYFASRLTEAYCTNISEFFLRDHSTILHAIERTENMLVSGDARYLRFHNSLCKIFGINAEDDLIVAKYSVKKRKEKRLVKKRKIYKMYMNQEKVIPIVRQKGEYSNKNHWAAN